MKFLVDAQLPKSLSIWFKEKGIDSIHTSELPSKNSTTDQAINNYSLNEKRIVVTKDADFLQSYKLNGKPYKLLLVSTGNITNQKLKEILEKQIENILLMFEENSCVELTCENIIIHN